MKKLIISSLYKNAIVLYKHQVESFITISNDYQVGDIYLGTVKKIFQSINAAFIHLQTHEKSGFIHANDSGPLKRQSTINRIEKILRINQKVLVQVIKESTFHKGPKLTANIMLRGRYIILMPFNPTICIARSITDTTERNFLRSIAILLKPLNIGLLFQASCAGISEDVLLCEINILRQQWNFIEKSVIVSNDSCLIHKNNDIITKVLQNNYDLSIDNITIDSRTILYQVKNYFQQHLSKTQYSSKKFELLKISDYYTIVSQAIVKLIKNLDNCIMLPSGGYIIIETSEALTTIDVNSGSFNSAVSQRENAFTTNCLAAAEIGYQLRKKNITGIIVIDFIDMRRKHDSLHLLQHFSEVLYKDPVRPQIVQLSQLGLIEVIRQRTSKNLSEIFSEYLLFISKYYRNTKKFSYSFYQNKELLNAIKSINKTNIITTKDNNNTFFFKRVFLTFYHVVYKKKNLQVILQSKKILRNHNVYLYKYKNITITTFLYNDMITHLFFR